MVSPDGAGPARLSTIDSFQTGSVTIGVVAEVPQFPIMNFHGKMWQNVSTCDKTWQKRAHLKQNTAKSLRGKGFVALLLQNLFVPTPSGSQ